MFFNKKTKVLENKVKYLEKQLEKSRANQEKLQGVILGLLDKISNVDDKSHKYNGHDRVNGEHPDLTAISEDFKNNLQLSSFAASQLVNEMEKPLFKDAEEMISILQPLIGPPDLDKAQVEEYPDES